MNNLETVIKEEVYKDIISFSDKLNNIANEDMESIIKIKGNIRNIRREKGLKISHFENKGIMKLGTLKNIEKISYKYKPNLDSCIRFAYGCGVDINKILEGLD